MKTYIKRKLKSAEINLKAKSKTKIELEKMDKFGIINNDGALF